MLILLQSALCLTSRVNAQDQDDLEIEHSLGRDSPRGAMTG